MPDSAIVGNRLPEQPRPTPEFGRPSPENPTVPPEQPAGETPVTAVEAPLPLPPTPISVTPVVPSAAVRHQVEHVLSEGLAPTYKSLDPAVQEEFKRVGEETAGKISILLQSAKVQAKKIVELIMSWLKIIPGVNAFFLEQEAKIKADKILNLQSSDKK